MKDVKKILEDHGFDVAQQEDGGWYIHQYTPAGEDWGFDLHSLAELHEYAENFDPEEEFIMWANAKKDGTQGIPGIPELWDDQLWKQEILKECANEAK